MCSRTGQTASEWWCWELIGRESFSFDGWNGLADEVIPSRRQPVSHKHSGLYNFVNGQAQNSLGPTVLAAQSVLLVSASTMYQAPFALSVASAVR